MCFWRKTWCEKDLGAVSVGSPVSQSDIMKVLRCLFLLVFGFSLSASPTRARVVDPCETSAPSSLPATNTPILDPTALTPRTVETITLPFRSFLSLGSGWNIYYSSWHASALPIQPAAWASQPSTHTSTQMREQHGGIPHPIIPSKR